MSGEIAAACSARDELLIKRALIVDKQQIVHDGIKLLEEGIAHATCKFAILEEENNFTGLQYRWGERKYNEIHELANAAR